MRAAHCIAVLVQFIGLCVALYAYQKVGGEFLLVFAGWCVFWGAYSLCALRADRKEGVRA